MDAHARTHTHSLACTSDSKTVRTKGGASGVVATFNPIFLHSNSFSDNSSDGSETDEVDLFDQHNSTRLLPQYGFHWFIVVAILNV